MNAIAFLWALWCDYPGVPTAVFCALFGPGVMLVAIARKVSGWRRWAP